MLRSMFSGVAGLRNHQVKMDVLSNNISNVNTYGYKASRVSFQEMYNQTMSTASAPSAAGTTGGINPKQIGLGVTTAAIDVLHTDGATQTTDRALDLMIEGEGMFTIKNGDQTFYTRAGNFYLDPYGYLVSADGLYVQGAMLIDAMPDTGIEESVLEVVEGDERIIWGDESTLEGLSEEEALPIYAAGEDGISSRDEMFGRIVIPTNYKQISIDKNGVVSALNENDEPVQVAVLTITTFINNGGLNRVGSNLYSESNNSGVPAVSIAGINTAGELKSGALEMSNVDLSKEFTDMIVTQRGFQANSRIITVSDTLLEELINLKR